MNETPFSNVVDSILQMRCDTSLKRQMLLVLKSTHSTEQVIDELLDVIAAFQSRLEAPLSEHYRPEFLHIDVGS